MNIGIDDRLQPLNVAIREVIPGNPTPSTKWRWTTRGLAPASDGEPRIKLPVWYVGRQPHTTKAAILQWLNDVTQARLARMDRTQERSVDVTDAELSAAGLL